MDLTGTYDVNTPAGLVTVTLRVTTSGQLEGELRAGTGMLRLAGMTDGHRGEGTATNDLGAQVVFQVERSGDQLGIQLVDLATGGVDAVVLQRRVAREAPAPMAAVAGIPAGAAPAVPAAATAMAGSGAPGSLVGTWYGPR